MIITMMMMIMIIIIIKIIIIINMIMIIILYASWISASNFLGRTLQQTKEQLEAWSANIIQD